VLISVGLAEMIYTCIGTALEYGIPLNRIFNETHRAKMQDDDSQVASILAKAMYEENETRNELFVRR
jgi:predicted HAD superfamily Cof-like phosphohydrolase